MPITPGGTHFRAYDGTEMPDKVLGKHRWIVIATYAVTGEALAAASRGEDVLLDQENLVFLAPGCVDCEQQYPAPEPCPAADEWGEGP